MKHVINFDFPTNVSDYILRVGRVGRVGSNQGYVTNLVVSAPGACTVQEIEVSKSLMFLKLIYTDCLQST